MVIKMGALELEDHVVQNLSRLLPGLKLSARNKKVMGKREVDIYAKDDRGKEYFIEVKASDCNRAHIGQMIEYRALLSKRSPNSELILICRSVDRGVREVLGKAGVKVKTFDELGIPAEMKPNHIPKGLSPTEQSAYFSLVRKGLNFVKTSDLASSIKVPADQAKNILASLARKSAAYRVGRGKYVLIPPDVLYERKGFVVDPLTMIDKLMVGREYYVAYQSAAYFHGIAEQLPFSVSAAVLKQKRPISLGNTSINFITLKPKKFFGFQEARYANSTLKVSDLEKTLVDCVDRYDLCGGIDEVACTLSNALDKLDGSKLSDYTEKLGSYATAQRIGFLLEKIGRGKVEYDLLKKLQKLVGRFTYPLDAKGPRKGRVSEKWKILENITIKRG